MSFGSAQGTVRYATILDTTQAERSAQGLKNTFTQLGVSGQKTSRDITGLNRSFTAGVSQINAQGNALANNTKQLQANSAQITTLGSKIKDTASRFAGFATGLAVTSSGVLQLAAGFRDFQDAQIAVERQQRKLSLAQEAYNKAQSKLKDLTDKGIKSGKAYAQAQLDVSQAQQQLSIMTQLLGERQEDLFDSQSQFVTSLIPTSLGAIGTLGAAFRDLGGDKGIGGLTTKFKGLGKTLKGGLGISSITSLIGPLALAIGPLVIGLLAWESAQRKVTAVTAEMDKAKHIENITTRVEAMNKSLDKLKEPFDIPAFNFLSKLGPGGLIDPIIEKTKKMNEEFQKSKSVSAQLKIAQDKLAAAQKNYNDMIGFGTEAQVKAAKAELDKAKADLAGIKVLASKTKGTDDATIAVQKLDKAQKDAAKSTKTLNDWTLQASALQGGTVKNLNLTSKAYLDVHNTIVKLTPAITDNITKQKEQDEIAKQTAKTLENLKGRVETTSGTFLGLGDTLDNVKAKFKALNDEAAKTKIPNADIVKFNQLLSQGNLTAKETLDSVNERQHKLAESSGFIAKLNELAWGASATSRFSNFKLVGSQAYDEIAQKAKEAADKAKAAWDQIMQSSDKAFKAKFKIESNADKIFKDLVKGLPDKVEKKVKLAVKFGQNIEDAKQAFNDFLGGATKVDDKTADKMANEVVQMIDKKFKGMKGPFAGLETQIKAAIANPNTPEALKQLLLKFIWPTVEVPSTLTPPPPIPPPKEAVEVPSIFMKPPPIPPPKEPVKAPAVFIPPPPIPPPKTPVKVPAVLDFKFSGGGSVGTSGGISAGADLGIKLPIKVPAVLGFPLESPRDPKEFTKGNKNEFGGPKSTSKGIESLFGFGSDKLFSPRALVPGTGQGDMLTDLWSGNFPGRTGNRPKAENPVIKGGGVLGASAIMGGGKSSNRIGIDIGAIINQIDTIAKRIMGLSAIIPKINVDNKPAIMAVDIFVKRILSIAAIIPKINVDNKPAIQQIDVIVKRILSLVGINPQIPVNNKPALAAIDAVAKRIDSLTKINPQIPVNNKPALKAVDAVAKRIDSLSKLNPDIHVNNKPAIKEVDVVAKRINDLSNINPTVHVGISGPGVKFAQHGMHETLAHDQLIMAHGGERVDIGSGSETRKGSSTGGGGSTGGNLTINNVIDIGTERIVRTVKRKLGQGFYAFGA